MNLVKKYLSACLSLALIAGALFAAPPRAYAVTCDLGSDDGAGQCRDFITATGSGTVAIPADWTSTNKIEVIGGVSIGQQVGSPNIITITPQIRQSE